MAKKTTVKAGRKARCLFALAVAAVTATTLARTVYDAGKALRQNCESGSYATPTRIRTGVSGPTILPPRSRRFRGLRSRPFRQSRTTSWSAGKTWTTSISR